MGRGWIGVDLDGTLAHYTEFKGEDVIGDPIMPMVIRVKLWLGESRDVRIFTARITHPNATGKTHRAIEEWCLKHVGVVLPITATKDWEMIELWDDRAVQVEANTGRVMGYSTRDLA